MISIKIPLLKVCIESCNDERYGFASFYLRRVTITILTDRGLDMNQPFTALGVQFLKKRSTFS